MMGGAMKRFAAFWGSVLAGIAPISILCAATILLMPSSSIRRYEPVPLSVIPTSTHRFSGVSAYFFLSELVERFPRRVTKTVTFSRAAEWARDAFVKIGLPARLEEFRSPVLFDRESELRHIASFPMSRFRGTYPGWNVVAGLAGRTEEVILVGAHLDVVAETTEGAGDDGSGVACVLELARLMNGSPRRHRFLFVLFDREERGMLGSSAFVYAHPELPLRHVVIVDSAAAWTDDIFMSYHPATHHGTTSAASIEVLASAAAEQGYVFSTAGPDVRAPFPINILIDRAISSGHTDYASFLDRIDSSVGIGTWSTRARACKSHTDTDNLTAFTPASLEKAGRVVQRYLEEIDVRDYTPSDPLSASAPLPGDRGAYAEGFVTGRTVGRGLLACASAIAAAFVVVIARTRRALAGFGKFMRKEWPFVLVLLGAPFAIAVGLAFIPFLPFSAYVGACVVWPIVAYPVIRALARGLSSHSADSDPAARKLAGAILISLASMGWLALRGPFSALLVAGPAILVCLPLPFTTNRERRVSALAAVVVGVYTFLAGFATVFFAYNDVGLSGISLIMASIVLIISANIYGIMSFPTRAAYAK
jgi:uncharacterized membrane protein